MAGEDILLSVGISLASLKSAQKQIDAELATWKTSSNVNIIDKKQLSDTEKMTKELTKEFSKLGTAVGKNNLSSYLKIDPSVATKATDAFQKINKETEAGDSQLTKLAQTTAFYNSKSVIMKQSLSDVKAELSSYLKVEAQGVTLDAVSLSRKEELTVAYQKLAKEQKGFFHGIDIPRLMLWAVGWKIMYGALNIVINSVKGVAESMIAVNEVLNRTRILHEETGRVFDKTYSDLRKNLYSTAEGSRVAVREIAQAFQVLTYEGASLETSMTALAHVRDLMVITGEKEKPIASALVETYGLFKDKISGAVTESEKLAKITDLLAAVFTKANLTIAEYQQIMSLIAPTAADAVESYEFLVRLLIFTDDRMLQGRRAGMALMETLVGLVDNTNKLANVFGIVFKPGETVTVEEVLRRISVSVKDLDEVARKDLLGKIFKGSSLRLVLDLLKEEDLTLSSLTLGMDGLGAATAKAADKAHFIGNAFKSEFEKIGSAIGSAWEKFNEFMADVVKKQAEYEFKKAFESSREGGILGTASQPIFSNRLIEAGNLREADFTRNLMAARSAIEELPKGAPRIFTQEEIKNSVTITQELKKQLDIIEQEANIKILESSGISAVELRQVRITNAAEKASALIGDEYQRRVAISALEQDTGADKIALYKMAMSYANDEKIAQEYVNEIIEARLELTKQMIDEVKSLADTLQGTATDFLKDAFSGNVDVKGFLSNIMGNFKSSLAENLTQMFGESTGIFASMASSFMSPLQKAHYGGIKSAVPLIMQAHIDGIRQGLSGQSSGAGGVSSIGGIMQSATGINGLMQNASSFWQSLRAQVGQQKAEVFGGATEAVVAPSDYYKSATATGKISDTLTKVGELAGKAIGVASFAMSLADAYKYKGSGQVVGAAMNLGVSGGIAGFAVAGPIGAAIGAAAGAIFGAIQAGTSKTTSETKQSTIEITSAIKISNRELQLVNRNLEGFRKGFEGYILATSSYFSERRGVEERFNLASQSGYSG